MSVSLPLIGLVQLARDQVICKGLGKTPGEVNVHRQFAAQPMRR
jgi:hypothetical protein